MAINPAYSEDDIIRAIAQSLEDFYDRLIKKVDELTIESVLKSKNPYLFRAKAIADAAELVDAILSATVSSSEETIFGNVFFEPLAVAASGGYKSIAKGIDVEVNTYEVIHGIAVKSGTKVFNADSKERQEQNFIAASKLAQQARKSFDPIVGYGYGRLRKKGTGRTWFFRELAGKEFWEEITGDPEFYLKIVHYMGTMPERYVEKFKIAYANAANRMVRDFSTKFCRENGSIDWDAVVRFNSGC